MTPTAILSRLVPIDLPIFQAPMAGVSTPRLAATVSDAGGLGALGLGAADPAAARDAIVELQGRTRAPFNVNFFCHEPARRNRQVEDAWIRRTAPLFAEFEAAPPAELHEIYDSFRNGDDFLRLVLDLRPAVVSFHFGLPLPHQITAMREAGMTLMGSATSLAEARQVERAGLHAVIAQGWEAGGHRGIFDPDGLDERLSTRDLTRQLVRDIRLPIIAAGGIMDGGDIRRALDAGAVAAQLGTAFVGCPESAADQPYRERLRQGGTTRMVRAISGRPARCLSNRFTDWASDIPAAEIPAYPCTYDLGKALNAAAKTRGESGYGAQWSGAEASRARFLPARDLVAALVREMGARTSSLPA